MNKTFRICIFIFFVFLQNTYATEIQKTNKFISIADIHFDPFIGCEKEVKPCSLISKLRAADAEEWESIFEKNTRAKLSHYGQDTNYFLLKDTLNELKKINQKEKTSFIVILGDFLVHDFRDKFRSYSGRSSADYQLFIKKTLQFLTLEINKAFPNTDIYSAVGNNDSYTGDYSVIPHGKFLQETDETWSMLIKNKKNKELFKKSFSNSGYYEVMVPEQNDQKIIILNTVLFSKKVRGPNNKLYAEAQLKWLRSRLDLAQKNHQKVIIAFHIPPDINLTGVLKDNFGLIWKFWQTNYWKEFSKISNQYSDTVTVILSAHIHRDIFQFIMLNSFSKTPVNITPAISPIFGNNPAFKVFTYQSPAFTITNVDTYRFDLSNDDDKAWKADYSMHLPHNVILKEKTTS